MSGFTVDNLVIDGSEFRAKINAMLNLVDADMEGYSDPSRQRDMSIKFHWGHNHDFGDFHLEGMSADRHLSIIASFIDAGWLPQDLTGKHVLDIGCWTGGTSLLLSAMGAQVTAIEEVRKYADAAAYLGSSFGVDTLAVHNSSLFDLGREEFQDKFDYIMYSGVIYHVTDPIISLRHVFNALKDGGTALVETYASVATDNILEYEGPGVFSGGSEEELNRRGWNWFVPSVSCLSQMVADVGFDNVRNSGLMDGNRCLATGVRTEHRDMLRAGLSVPGVR